jgi:hypothetical protein
MLLSKIHAKHSFRISAGGPGAKKEQTFTTNSKQLPFQTSSLSKKTSYCTRLQEPHLKKLQATSTTSTKSNVSS